MLLPSPTPSTPPQSQRGSTIRVPILQTRTRGHGGQRAHSSEHSTSNSHRAGPPSAVRDPPRKLLPVPLVPGPHPPEGSTQHPWLHKRQAPQRGQALCHHHSLAPWAWETTTLACPRGEEQRAARAPGPLASLRLHCVPAQHSPRAGAGHCNYPGQEPEWVGTLQKPPTEPREVTLHGECQAAGLSRQPAWGAGAVGGGWSGVLRVPGQPPPRPPPSRAAICPTSPSSDPGTDPTLQAQGPKPCPLRAPRRSFHVTHSQPVSSPAKWANSHTCLQWLAVRTPLEANS